MVKWLEGVGIMKGVCVHGLDRDGFFLTTVGALDETRNKEFALQ